MNERTLALLEESRKREKDQAFFYRQLAAQAGSAGNEALAERLNDLHADEQHHLSRLTARIFELDGIPAKLPSSNVPVPALEAWEAEARSREEAELAWYRGVLEESVDADTRDVLREIRESEEHHARELAGKWMSA